jgi:hypothetical protein
VRTTVLLSWFAAGALVAPVVWAASSSMTLVISVVSSSGACSTTVQSTAVDVSCGSAASVPLLPPVGVGGGLAGGGSQAALLGAAFGTSAAPFVGSFAPESGPSDPQRDPASPVGDADPPDHGRQQVAVLPSSVTGRSPLPVFSGGANVSSWRVVSIDNAQHVELTISW